jgi:hypothetical protein
MLKLKISFIVGTLLISVFSAAGALENKKGVYRVKFPITNHQLNIDITSEPKVQTVLTGDKKPVSFNQQNQTLLPN